MFLSRAKMILPFSKAGKTARRNPPPSASFLVNFVLLRFHYRGRQAAAPAISSRGQPPIYVRPRARMTPWEGNMILLFDPYANRHWSIADVRLVNKVADALYAAHDDLDLTALSTAIRRAYRPGMHAHALMLHVSRELRLPRAA